MIKRLVKLTFRDECVPLFTEHFEKVRNRIGTMPGCRSLELLRASDEPNVFITFSTWDSENDLNNYRKSDLYRQTWSVVKTWFSEPAKARSVTVVEPA